MSKRSRRREVLHARTLSLPEAIDTYNHAVSRLARLGLVSSPSVFSPSSSSSLSRLDRSVQRRPLPVRSTGERLRSSPLSISPTYLSRMPHGTKREAVSCVKTHLKEMRTHQGSGKASRISKNRQAQRRSIFQAARKSC